MSMTPLPAWTYQRVEQVGFQETGFFEELLVQVTPRLFWPDKPNISPGRDFSITIGQFRNVEEASSSTAVTLQGAYYWRGGYAWLVLGCALSGAAFGAAWLLFRNHLVLNPASAIVALMLCHEGFRWFESAFLGGFPMFLYVLIVFLPLQLVMRRVVGYRPVPGFGRSPARPATARPRRCQPIPHPPTAEPSSTCSPPPTAPRDIAAASRDWPSHDLTPGISTTSSCS